MGSLVFLRFLSILLWLTVAKSMLQMEKSHCSDTCGNVTVPYPFGFGAEDCYREESFGLTCNNSYSPPKLFSGNMEVLDISLQGQQRLLSYVSVDCYDKLGQPISGNNPSTTMPYPIFTFSDTENRLTNGSCTGIGCCQTSIPKGVRNYDIYLYSFENHTNVFDFNPCSYAFLVDMNWLNFSVSDLLNFNHSIDETGVSRMPDMYDWAVDNKTCEEAKKNMTSYAYGFNSVCGISKNGVGYSCNCSQGYQGNAYLPRGCQDINECEDRTKNDYVSTSTCINLLGSYNCLCPAGYSGDGKKMGIDVVLFKRRIM